MQIEETSRGATDLGALSVRLAFYKHTPFMARFLIGAQISVLSAESGRHLVAREMTW
jgi:hypothetical protein